VCAARAFFTPPRFFTVDVTHGGVASACWALPLAPLRSRTRTRHACARHTARRCVGAHVGASEVGLRALGGALRRCHCLHVRVAAVVLPRGALPPVDLLRTRSNKRKRE
jgi:hypothetical protein